jgi:hypothetical protein
MKEKGSDHAVSGFKVPTDGWHLVEFQDGIDYLTNKEGVQVQNEKGFKTYKFPAIIKDDNDPDNGIANDQLAGMENGGGWVANILACVGLWDAVCKKFPGDDVSVFNQPVMDGIKVKLPGRSCMMRTEVDKDGRARTREMASLAKYKEILKEQKAKQSAKGGAPVEGPRGEVAAAGATDSWD